MCKFRPKYSEEYLKEQRELMESRRIIKRTLEFKGYFENTEGIPATCGVYAAFAQNGGGVARLLYIGRAYMSNNLKKRIQEHIDDDHKSEKWQNHYNPRTEVICYAYAVIDDDAVIPDIEKTLIHENKPEINYQDVENNNVDARMVRLMCTGDKGCLKASATLGREIK